MSQATRNRYGFGLGTIGRDAAYTLVSMYLIFYLSDVLAVSTGVLAAVTVVLVIARIFDAVNDPFMGVIVDNTRSRWGKFKPWIVGGAVLSAVFMIVMFTQWHLGDVAFVVVFAAVYLAWEITFTANDIAYWSMLPTLSQDQKERERIGAFARICANIGAFGMVVAIVPLSDALTEVFGSRPTAYTVIAAGAVVLMLVFQFIMVFLVKEDPTVTTTEERTKFSDLVTVIFKNDQLLVVTVALLLFMTAFTVTTSLGLFYFKYVFGDEGMYSLFALVLGVSQLSALALYPLLAKKLNRRTVFTLSMLTVAVGYVLFFFVPIGSGAAMAIIIIAGVLVFAAQAAIQLLMLMFIADTVEYGQHKFGRRNDSVTLSLQPFIYKMGSAISSGVIGWVVIASGMHDAEDASDMTESGALLVKVVMFLLPLILTVLSWVVYRLWFRIDEARYESILAKLRARDGAVHE